MRRQLPLIIIGVCVCVCLHDPQANKVTKKFKMHITALSCHPILLGHVPNSNCRDISLAVARVLQDTYVSCQWYYMVHWLSECD